MNYETLLKLLEDKGLDVVELPFSKGIKGLYADNVIAINSKLETAVEKKCTLAEEVGHYYTTFGNILDQTKVENRKQELKARRFAVTRLIRLEDFIEAFESGVRTKYELAEFLEVTEDFLEMSLEHFKSIYGLSHSVNDYIIYFNPLSIFKKI